MYSVHQYGQMIADRVRTGAYQQALQRVVSPGSAVLDIGTGSGILALLACRAGARRVYAIESDDVIHMAKQLASANGFADRIEFIQGRSTQISLPEPVDVVISDLHGTLPLCFTSLQSLIDARQRLLSPGGVMIPQRESLWASVVEAASLHKSYLEPWTADGLGLDLGPVQRIVTNDWYRTRVGPEQLLAEPQRWAQLDYQQMGSPNVEAQVEWRVTRAGTGHGLVLWFDTQMLEGIGFSNAPGQAETVYGHAYFPWPRPVELALGDVVSATLQATLSVDNYVWRWDTTFLDQGKPGGTRASFQQSTFFSMPMSPDRARKHSEGYVPSLNEEGEMDRLILALVDTKTTLGGIAGKLMELFPSHFSRPEDALTRVCKVTQRYDR